MAFDSFRGWVKQLEQAGELKRVTQPVATELEITELAAAHQDGWKREGEGGKVV